MLNRTIPNEPGGGKTVGRNMHIPSPSTGTPSGRAATRVRGRCLGILILAGITLILLGLAERAGDGRCACGPHPSLVWLFRHQNPDGSWGDLHGPREARTRLTALALLDLSAGGIAPGPLNGDVYANDTGAVATRALCFLAREMCASPPDRPWGEAWEAHLWGTLALAMTQAANNTDATREAAGNAVEIMERILGSGETRDGAWDGFEPDDPVQKALVVIILAAARAGNLPPRAALTGGVDAALEDLLARESAQALDPVQSAAALAAWRAWHRDTDDLALFPWAERILAHREEAAATDADFHFWGTLALQLYGPPRSSLCKSWNETLMTTLLPDFTRHNRDPDLYGTWDPPATVGRLAPVSPETAARFRDLLPRLSADAWETREAASVALARFGREALPLMIETAATHADGEVRSRLAAHVRARLQPGADNRRIEITTLNALSLFHAQRYRQAPGEILLLFHERTRAATPVAAP
jgi:hypothetical protein